ncbi:MAG: hypothetical protein NC048_10075 [Bacteroides sp.]|nr:hypothetical protein [Bacteroides sp.]
MEKNGREGRNERRKGKSKGKRRGGEARVAGAGGRKSHKEGKAKNQCKEPEKCQKSIRKTVKVDIINELISVNLYKLLICN